ncbi:hypothetical protein ACH5RR_023935 [Cinchona calisaya]|uniref:Peptidase M48 domain-containing protein n=1 Tax=Cinchona calisaya TaxID=153742 RepID=A0ABD2ZC58_9GENT
MIEHFDGLNWKVMVVDSYSENAGYTGWLKRYKTLSDAKIATVLVHEVRHGLGQHPSEHLIRFLWLFVLIFLPLCRLPNANGPVNGGFVGAMLAFFCRRRELEADYIGIMLIVAAGYYPQNAPKVLEARSKPTEGNAITSSQKVKEPDEDWDVQVFFAIEQCAFCCTIDKKEGLALTTGSTNPINYNVDWIIDFEYSNHMIGDKRKLTNLTEYKGGRVVVTVDNSSLQFVPVSNKPHVTISRDRFENFLGTLVWENEARKNADKILSPSSPESIRVHRILKQILRATHDRLGLKNDYRISVYKPREDLVRKANELGQTVWFNTKLIVRELPNYGNNNTKNVKVKPRRVRKFGLMKYGTENLDGLNWEVMVVDSCIDNAGYIPNGKIIFYTGWFKGYKTSTDAEIATILAHEVGHGIGRHASENLIRVLWLYALIVLPLQGYVKNHQDHRAITMVVGAILAFFSRRSELEADYIVMMLMAAAGYDPQTAPKFLEKNGGIETDIVVATHPSGETRAKKLQKVEVMRKAMDIYNLVQAGHQIQTFI